ncbi:helix-turn-helix transcriptional regulator [Kitasatospora aureofaciens]|uniref:helix-turn-helix domain-containing protein n=1 Tax=Kitasatospora aureofaciens TaxID=1894 RepID=UPI001C491A32|nr:helix-turn-helix transcriptional regulator [Kitasatospora aureofaciens]MBV6700600.1 helix-turn-helix transcriptional regulator [Kitasatospora aureofaciens]
MPPRLSPTVRQQRLGIELRKMRERVGVTPKSLAATLGTDLPKISQMENGKSGISAERLRIWARTCDCADGPYLDALLAMTRDRRKYWWDGYRGRIPSGIIDIAEMEHHAEALTILHTSFIPGLLQTSAYATAVFARLRPPLPWHETDVRTAFRIQRQQILVDRPKPYTAFVHESALRMQFGGPAVLREQLLSLLEDSERPGVEIRAIPFSVDTFPGSGESLYLACGPVPELDTVQIDLSQGPKFVHTDADLRTYREIKAETEAIALGPDESRDFIRTMLNKAVA